jgi:hypothetical protein
VALQNFRPDLCLNEELRRVAPFPPDELEAFRQVVASAAERVVVRGQDHAALAASEPE